MIGRRVVGDDVHLFQPGDYGYWWEGGHWVAETPNGHGVNLGGHKVVEHEDGTITVSPSIAVYSSRPSGAPAGMESYQVYHGFLEAGVWRVA